MMRTLAIVLAAIGLTACSDDTREKAFKELIDNCARPVAIEVRVTTWGNNEVAVRCEEMKKGWSHE